jgi:hypothetical protein
MDTGIAWEEWGQEKRTATEILREMASKHERGTRGLELEWGLTDGHLRRLFSEPARGIRPATARVLMHRSGLPFIALALRHEPVADLVIEESRALTLAYVASL